MRIFLTGASGFIGSRILPALQASGHQVIGLARSESIYRQAVAHYNDTLCKPWCRLPGHLLGFDRDTGEDAL